MHDLFQLNISCSKVSLKVVSISSCNNCFRFLMCFAFSFNSISCKQEKETHKIIYLADCNCNLETKTSQFSDNKQRKNIDHYKSLIFLWDSSPQTGSEYFEIIRVRFAWNEEKRGKSFHNEFIMSEVYNFFSVGLVLSFGLIFRPFSLIHFVFSWHWIFETLMFWVHECLRSWCWRIFLFSSLFPYVTQGKKLRIKSCDQIFFSGRCFFGFVKLDEIID